MSARRRMAGALLACLLASVDAAATTITVVNLDAAGEGFNDPSPVAPVGGNAGVTLGQQRLIVFQRAAETWESIIDSAIEIRVGAQFSPLACSPTGATLGSAGPESVFRDFAGAPLPGTWFAVALASSLAGVDLDPTGEHVGAAFSSNLDEGCLSGVAGWYYGLDGNTPSGRIELLDTVLHELAHGFGFVSLVSLATGQKLLGFDDAYMRNLEDHSTGELFPAMTNAERVTASTDTGDLHWVGPNVVATSSVLSAGVHASGHVEMYAPSPVQPGSSVSHFSTALTPDEIMEPFATPSSFLPITVALMADLGWTLACGDGLVVPPEACDDGDNLDGDGCSRSCAVEQCFACAGEPSVCAPVVDGTPCDDLNSCTGADACQAGACVPGASTGAPCDDFNPCTESDLCVGPTCTGSFPLASCIAPDLPAKAFLQLRDQSVDARDALLWRWVRGTTAKSAFGDPTAGTPYALCVFDAVDGSLMSLAVPPGPLWRETASGFVYTDGSLGADGVRRIVLRAGSGSAKVLVRGKGPGLDMTDLGDLDLPLTVQMTNGSACWEAVYQSNVILSLPDHFKAKAD